MTEVRKTKLGPEVVTSDIQTFQKKHSVTDEQGIVRIGAEVHPGDILLVKITPKGEQELSAKRTTTPRHLLVKKLKRSPRHNQTHEQW